MLKIKIEDLNIAINEQRLLVFLETIPQSNKYNQILLSKKQFRRVSDAVCTIVKERNKNDLEVVKVQQSEEEYVLPDLQSICPSQ